MHVTAREVTLICGSTLMHCHNHSPGGADWWRAASEHARRAAGGGVSLDFLTGPLNSGFVPTFGNLGLGIEGSPPGLDSLFMVPADGDKSKGCGFRCRGDLSVLFVILERGNSFFFVA